MFFCYNVYVVKLVDMTDLKSIAVKGVGVQVPPFPVKVEKNIIADKKSRYGLYLYEYRMV